MQWHGGTTTLLMAMVAVIACSGGSTASAPKPTGAGATAAGPAQALTVKGTDQYRFEPNQLTARAGQPIRLTLDDTGTALVHDLTIDSVGGQKVEVKAQPNARAIGEFTAPAGTYQFYCAEPGHRELGMVGTLTVN